MKSQAIQPIHNEVKRQVVIACRTTITYFTSLSKLHTAQVYKSASQNR